MSLKKFLNPRLAAVEQDTSLAEVQRIFQAAPFHHLLVVEHKVLVGIISDRDLFKALSPNLGTAAETRKDTATLNKKAHQIMSRPVRSLHQKNDIYDAIDLFLKHKISCVPIVDEYNHPIGMISWRDILALLAAGKRKKEQH
ncbi:CBS domain-containing protein [Lacimicrobium sp. SS2-24]|uniref:CBS domain-containing protein n=1 Tax=Lacimicrobium sp. SS2-24 TaxID=2005569 RepID=UPI000B4BE2AA|nr:CBS domain-containing protein [Lacimicrobium sp. SS2-24]